jgi:hypothetical protein
MECWEEARIRMGNRSPIMNRMEEFTSGIGILHQSLLMSPWKNAQRPSTNELTLFTSFSSPASTPPPGSASCFTNCLILFLPFHPAHNIGLATCTNPCSLASLCLSLGVVPGAYDWRGDCTKCLRPVREMEGIFCANFSESREGWRRVG